MQNNRIQRPAGEYEQDEKRYIVQRCEDRRENVFVRNRESRSEVTREEKCHKSIEPKVRRKGQGFE